MFASLCADDSAGGERPLGLYSTAEQAAIARDEAVLRAEGLASRALLNHSVDTYSHVSHLHTQCNDLRAESFSHLVQWSPC